MCQFDKIAFHLDPAFGCSIDWVYNKLNVSLVYTFEFRDKGKCRLGPNGLLSI